MARRGAGRRLGLFLAALVLAAAGLGGCAANGPAAVQQAAASRDPLDRGRAAYQLSQLQVEDRDVTLIHLLADDDEGVRFYASAALYRSAHERFGYEPAAPPAERARAILRWIDWYVGTHQDAPAKFEPLKTQMVALSGADRVPEPAGASTSESN